MICELPAGQSLFPAFFVFWGCICMVHCIVYLQIIQAPLVLLFGLDVFWFLLFLRFAMSCFTQGLGSLPSCLGGFLVVHMHTAVDIAENF
jgi:hypothetical protein